MTKSKYSIWLIPSEETYDKLSGIVAELSDRYGTPSFIPHVTLLGGLVGYELEIAVKTSKLADRLKPFTVQLAKADYRDEYFRALFILAEKTGGLMEAYEEARKIFGVENRNSYMPHLSLLYGDLDVAVKEKILAKIGREFRLSFVVCAIHLFSTTGEVQKWHKIKEFTLNHKNKKGETQ